MVRSGDHVGYAYKPGLLIPRQLANARTRGILDAEIRTQKLAVISFPHDRKLNAEIKRAATWRSAGLARMAYDELPPRQAELGPFFQRFSGQLVAVVAHSEGGDLVRLAGSDRPRAALRAISSARASTTRGEDFAAFGSVVNPIVVKGIRELDDGSLRVEVERSERGYTFKGAATSIHAPSAPAIDEEAGYIPRHSPGEVLFSIFLIWASR